VTRIFSYKESQFVSFGWIDLMEAGPDFTMASDSISSACSDFRLIAKEIGSTV
jgi:hypothetical protein